jgi:hypothetical protein
LTFVKKLVNDFKNLINLCLSKGKNGMKNKDWEYKASKKSREASQLVQAGKIEEAYKILLELRAIYEKNLKVRNSHDNYTYITYTDILQSLKEIEQDPSKKEEIYLAQIKALNTVEERIKDDGSPPRRNKFLIEVNRFKAKLYNEKIEELKSENAILDRTSFKRIKDIYTYIEEENAKIAEHVKERHISLETELESIVEIINYKKSFIKFLNSSTAKDFNSGNELYQLTMINNQYQSFYELLKEYVKDNEDYRLMANSENSDTLEKIYKEFANLLDDIRDLQVHTLNNDNLKEEAIKVREELKQYYLDLNNQEEAKKQQEALSRLQVNQVNSLPLEENQRSHIYQSESLENIDLNDEDFLDLNEELISDEEPVALSPSTLKRSNAELEETENQESAKKIKTEETQFTAPAQEVAENPVAKFVVEQLQKKPLKSILVTRTETVVNFDGSVKATHIGFEPEKQVSKSKKEGVSWKAESRLNKYAEPEDFNKFYNHLNLTFAEEIEIRNRNIKITETPSGDLMVSRDITGMKEWEKKSEIHPPKFRNIELRDGINEPLSNFPPLKLNKGPKKDNPSLARYKEATNEAWKTLNTEYQKEDFSNRSWLSIIKSNRTGNNISDPDILQKPLTKEFHALIREQRRVFNTNQNSNLKVYKTTPMSAMQENAFLFNETLREQIIEDSRKKHEESLKNKLKNRKNVLNTYYDEELTSLGEYTSSTLTNLNSKFEAARKALNEKLINDYHNKFDGADYTTLGNDVSSIFNGTHSLSFEETNKVISKMTVIAGLLAKELNPMIEAHEKEVKALKLQEEEAKKAIEIKRAKSLHDLENDHQKELKEMEDKSNKWQEDAEKRIREICGISERDWREHLTSPRSQSGNDRSL